MINKSQMQEYSQFTIAHQLKCRIRIIAPCLLGDKERAYILEILLLKREAINKVKIVSKINSVTIHFNPDIFPKENLLNLLEIVLANFSKKPRESITKLAEKPVRKNVEKQDIIFGIGGMSCASCALFLEMVLSREVDNLHVSINYMSETGLVTGYLKKVEIFKIIEQNGYQAYSIDSLAERKLILDKGKQHLLSTKKRVLLISLLSIPVMLSGLLLRKTLKVRFIQAIFSLSAIYIGGKDVFKKSWIQARKGKFNMDALISIGVTSAFTVSIPALFVVRKHAYFEAATAIIGFVQLGRYLEEFAKNTMVGEVEALVSLQPQNASLLRGGNELQIPTDKIKIDDELMIRPGERIPVDGVVQNGLSSVDESMITGSNSPCVKAKGSELFEGSINGSGMLQMKAVAIGENTVLAGLMHMIDQARSSKLDVQNTVDVVSSSLMPAIMFLSVITFAGRLARGEGLAHAFANAISVILISCPCALGLATPAATSVSYGNAAKRRVYIRNGNAFEILASIDTIVFDKTGTLTEGKGSVSNFFNKSDWDDDYIVQLAASAEFNSEHLFGKAIVEYAHNKGLSNLKYSRFHSIPDQGVRCLVDGHEVLLGNENWLCEQSIDVQGVKDVAEKWALQGDTLIYLVVDNQLAALFSLNEQIRKGVKQLMGYLQAKGIETALVTGDTETSARPVADFCGIELVKVKASPAKKIQFIRELQNKGKVVAMIGDGINDAPALAAANVSLVVNNATGIAVEAADYVLFDGDISKVAEVLDISKMTLVVVKQNLLWAFSYNAIAIPIAMAGKLNPMISSAAMAFSSVSVIANSLRLNKK